MAHAFSSWPRRTSAVSRRALLLLMLLPAGLSARSSDRRPDIILISIDNLRADHLGCYGYGRGTSPNLDSLARSASLFENHISPSAWTLPAHMSMLTSMYPSYHGMTRHPARWDVSRALAMSLNGMLAAWKRLTGSPIRYGPAVLLDRLRPGLRTLPEVLRAAGYRTGAVVASENLRAALGFSRGFDSFVQNPERTPAARQNAAALQWIAERPSHPFFLFLHYYDLHHTLKPGEQLDRTGHPYDCPGPSQSRFLSGLPEDFRARPLRRGPHGAPAAPLREREWLVGLYDGCIRSVDSGLGEFLEALRKKDVLDHAVLIVTSDHGEEFWDHGAWGHGQSLHQELVHVPLWLKLPGRPGRRVQALTSGVDIMPTILDAARTTPDDLGSQMQGLSLLPFVDGLPPDRDAVFSERDFRTSDRAVFTQDGWKLLQELDSSRTMLFNLLRDPRERADRSAERPQKRGELEELLAGFYSGPLER